MLGHQLQEMSDWEYASFELLSSCCEKKNFEEKIDTIKQRVFEKCSKWKQLAIDNKKNKKKEMQISHVYVLHLCNAYKVSKNRMEIYFYVGCSFRVQIFDLIFFVVVSLLPEGINNSPETFRETVNSGEISFLIFPATVSHGDKRRSYLSLFLSFRPVFRGKRGERKRRTRLADVHRA